MHNIRNMLKNVIHRDVETCMQWNKGIYSMYMFIIGGVKQKKIANGLKSMYSVYMFWLGGVNERKWPTDLQQ